MNTETAIPVQARGFQYKHGDRPLEGYMIERGAGRGGFGEVYYAISDGGREVALKLIQTYEQIELRGVAHCMNLKSPHLISIFDVKYAEDGRPWVIMEYVSGPSLRELLDAAPSGLGVQKAAFFLREIAKGLTYLHECGIVHRDLKPGNIFYENGYVKIGDYGLSKAISASQYSGQTVTVGTVHYMAPEIGEGRYDKSIDIYAMGALLFEMLTGQVPFFGSSPAEVLMKHLSSSVDVSNIEEPFASVIRKAMAKNPADRYQTVQEMVEAVFGSEHVRNSVSCFSPDSLSMVAGQVARKLPGNSSFSDSSSPGTDADAAGCFGDRIRRNGHVERNINRGIERMSARFNRARDRLEQKFGALTTEGSALVPMGEDAIPMAQRCTLALVGVGIVALGTALAASSSHNASMAVTGAFTFAAALGASVGVILGRNKLWPAVQGDQKLLQHLSVGGIATLFAAVASLPAWVAGSNWLPDLGPAWAIIALSLFLISWSKRSDPTRLRRVNFGHLITAALPGLICGFNILAIGVACGVSLAIEVIMPWRPRRQQARPSQPARQATPPGPPAPAVHTAPPAMPMAQMQLQTADLPLGASAKAFQLPVIQPGRAIRTTSRAARVVWLIFFCALAILSLTLLLLLGFVQSNPEEQALMLGWGGSTAFMAIFCLRRSRLRVFAGWWPHLIKPIIQLICITGIWLSISFMGLGNIQNNDWGPAIFFLVASVVILATVTFLLHRGVEMSAPAISSPVLQTVDSESSFSLVNLVSAVGRLAMNLIASAILLLALLAGVAVAGDLPGLFNSHLVDPQIPRDMHRHFGNADWPHMFRAMGAGASFTLAVISTLLFVLARRRQGALSMLRAAAGVGALFIAVVALSRALPDWSQLVPRDNPWEVVDQYMNYTKHNIMSAAIPAGIGILLLAWPASRARRARFAVKEEVVS